MSAETVVDRLKAREHEWWWLEEVEGGRVHVVFQAKAREYGQPPKPGGRVDRASLSWLKGDLVGGPSCARCSVPGWHGATLSSTTWRYLGQTYTHDTAQRCLTRGTWLKAKKLWEPTYDLMSLKEEKDSLDEAAEAWAGVDKAMEEAGE